MLPKPGRAHNKSKSPIKEDNIWATLMSAQYIKYLTPIYIFIVL